jgi:hypothetical protein
MLILLMGRYIKYASDVGSSAVIYVQTFMHIGSGMQKLLTETCSAHRKTFNFVSPILFYFFK